jgi:alginate O-acetyltransferase complex protein AlgI
MVFNSFHFAFFFIIVTTLYFALPYKRRWFLLLMSSCYFYMAFVPIYIFILGFTIVVDYFAGIYLEKTTGKKKKIYLIASLIANIGVLAVFKYYNFFNDNLSVFLQDFGYHNSLPFLSILLPIGLSFHTFQAMSYTIEVYRGRQKAERNFGIYALYVMFYPQLVSGPIERPQNLLHQFYESHHFDYDRITNGLKQMLWGFFKKIVIADRLGLYVNIAYNNPEQHTGMTLVLATIFFSFQIYCDFSGYSDIAIGAARVMGFNLMKNFNHPILAKSTSEHWRRWHISLSTWFKDFLYFPLGGSRVPAYRLYFNLFIVFFLSGFWHGANWTFIVWGTLNGFYVIFAIITKKYREYFDRFLGLDKIPRINLVINILITFGLITFSRVFFRANNLTDAFHIIRRMARFDGPIYNVDPSTLVYGIFGISVLLFVEIKQEYFPEIFSFRNHPHWAVRNLSYAFLVLSILLFGVFDGGQFIYFQF